MGFENKKVMRNRKRDYYWVGVKVVDSKKVEDEAQQTFDDLTDRAAREAEVEIIHFFLNIDSVHLD